MDFYRINIAGIERDLPICKISDDLYIAAFVILGDVEITNTAAKKLAEIAPEHDIIITAECKGIPLAHAMADVLNEKEYIVARKSVKLYMKKPISTTVNSITTEKEQTLFLDEADIKKMNGKRVLIIDDVISTGESLVAVEKLVEDAGGIIAGKMAILAEGDAKDRDDIKFLQYLPLFNADGSEKEL